MTDTEAKSRSTQIAALISIAIGLPLAWLEPTAWSQFVGFLLVIGGVGVLRINRYGKQEGWVFTPRSIAYLVVGVMLNVIAIGILYFGKDQYFGYLAELYLPLAIISAGLIGIGNYVIWATLRNLS